MKAAELRLQPESGAFPGVDTALAGVPGVTREGVDNIEWLADGSYAILYRLSGGAEDGAADAIRTVLAARDDVHDYDVIETAGDRLFAFVHVAEREPLSELLAIVDRYALLLDRPFAYTDEGIVVTVAGDGAALQAAFEEASETIPVAVEWTGGFDPSRHGPLAKLTDRQREAIEVAHALGFYETPRDATYADIGDALACAPSTANELLRRAEARLIDAVLDAGR